jgi:formylglycine-generating enzyme required for sulfatase activity
MTKFIFMTQITIPAGFVQLGTNESDIVFGWDNEFPPQVVQVPEFDIDDLPVTNAQFLEFVTSGHYENQSHWRPEDWEWKQKNEMHHPVFWKKIDNGSYKVICLFGEELDFQQVRTLDQHRTQFPPLTNFP